MGVQRGHKGAQEDQPPAQVGPLGTGGSYGSTGAVTLALREVRWGLKDITWGLGMVNLGKSIFIIGLRKLFDGIGMILWYFLTEATLGLL